MWDKTGYRYIKNGIVVGHWWHRLKTEEAMTFPYGYTVNGHTGMIAGSKTEAKKAIVQLSTRSNYEL